ncbi:PREDICTED: protein PFF0380w-like [Habropoda laboriosa]|uniref:protein PFF0380w-like n=1 Tax=Habropoda laboriosa TaxID=597456 RepID=UPI00083DEE44|nr:PREDICTED: protein PFF0380w-like [Habropoda laboriosa]
MFKIVYFIAGLLVRKLIPNTSTGKIKNFEPVKSEIIINKNVNKYSQDDNSHNQYFHNDIHHCHIRSKSASSYENKNDTEYPLSALNKFDNDLKNINNLDLENKYDKSVQKILYDKSYHTLRNISIEDNARCNLSNKILLENYNEKKKNKNYQLFESVDIKNELSNTAHSKINANMKDENLLETINTESMNNFNEKNIERHVKSQENIKFPETFNTLSTDFCEDSTIYKSLQTVKNSMISPNILPSYIDNVSNRAICNDDTCFDNEEEDILNFSCINEFHESDIISSTKQNNLEDV